MRPKCYSNSWMSPKHNLLAWMFQLTMGDLNIISIPEVTAALGRMKEDHIF